MNEFLQPSIVPFVSASRLAEEGRGVACIAHPLKGWHGQQCGVPDSSATLSFPHGTCSSGPSGKMAHLEGVWRPILGLVLAVGGFHFPSRRHLRGYAAHLHSFQLRLRQAPHRPQPPRPPAGPPLPSTDQRGGGGVEHLRPEGLH